MTVDEGPFFRASGGSDLGSLSNDGGTLNVAGTATLNAATVDRGGRLNVTGAVTLNGHSANPFGSNSSLISGTQ